MLPKENRLKKKKELARVFREGKGFRENFLFFKMIKNGKEINRFGFMVGKNLSKKATVRNRVRRKISELVRLKMKDMKKGIDAVFVAYPGLEKNKFSELGGAIDKIFIKAKLLK